MSPDHFPAPSVDADPAADDTSGPRGTRLRPERADRPDRPRPRLLGRLLVSGGVLVALLGVGGAVLVMVPVTAVDDYVRGVVKAQVAAQLGASACPGRPPATVEVPGSRLLRSVLSDRLPELRITAPDVAVGGAQHARVETVVRDLGDLRAEAPTAGRLTTTVSIAYADLPPPDHGPAADLSPTGDGRLQLSLATPQEQAERTTSTLLLRLSFGDGTVLAVPHEFRLFGRTVPLDNVEALTGGTRVTKLPALPAGVRYTAVSAQPDGIHVSLDGIAVTPLRTLPRRVDGRTISYAARDGRLGLSTSENVLGLFDVPLTIWTRPRLTPGRLVLDPVSVEILGEDRPPSDPLARTVLDQTDPSTLGRALPKLPSGVRYRFAAVDAEGIKVGVGGTTVQSFASLPNPTKGAKTVFGAEKGMLTVTTTGIPDGQGPQPLSLLARPTLDGDRLVLAPEVVRLFGVEFTPAAVFDATGGAPDTSFPLAPLAKGLSYSKVEATADGLRFTVTGRDLPLTSDLLGGDGCPPAPA